LPFIDIHTHRFVSANDILAVENVFAADIPKSKTISERLFSAGLHPWHINILDFEKDLAGIEAFAHHPQILAFGEAGLDKLCKVDFKLQEIVFLNGLDKLCKVDFKLQEIVFLKQLEIAAKTEKPMIIHCVKAFQEIISMYQKAKSKTTLIFHGFNNNRQIAESLIKQGFYLSFGHALLNQKSNAFRIFRQIPDDRFFLETDDSANSIEEIYAEAARIKGISILEMKSMVFKNFENCFKINA